MCTLYLSYDALNPRTGKQSYKELQRTNPYAVHIDLFGVDAFVGFVRTSPGERYYAHVTYMFYSWTDNGTFPGEVPPICEMHNIQNKHIRIIVCIIIRYVTHVWYVISSKKVQSYADSMELHILILRPWELT